LSWPAAENVVLSNLRERDEVNGENALTLLAVIAVVFLLHIGAPFFIPLFVGITIAFALSPAVDLIQRVVRSRLAASALVVAAALGLIAWGAAAWSDDVQRLWDQVPSTARAISGSFKKMAKTPESPVAEVKKAAAEIEAIASTGKATPPPPSSSAQPAPTSVSFWGMLWEGGKGVATAVSQVMAVIFLVFFMLASGDLFKRKLVKIGGTTLSQKKITVEVIDEIDRQIRQYLGVLLLSNVLVGAFTWIAFRMLGVHYAELWALGAGILHTAPYFGPAVIAAATLLAGFVQFDSWSHGFLVAGVSIGIATLVGSVFATWLASRQSRMNTTATFVGLLFFAWLWGLWGILLGIPLLAIVKTVCDHNDEWKPLAELLSK
jgi:predicted PurR-regulated permease PerM